MTVNVEVIEIADVVREFPLLRRSKANKFVVLFTNENTGTVLADPINAYGIGHHSTQWTDCNREAVWEPIGAVTLKTYA